MLSQDQITAIYCIVDDMLLFSGHKFDKRSQVTDSEIITIGLVAALCFGGVFQHAMNFLYDFGLFKNRICKSRLCRRLHRLESVIDEFIEGIGLAFTEYQSEKEFIIDSTSLEVCDNIRILHCKILHGEEFRGYKASFRRYFYGLRLQLLVTAQGIPVAYFITEGSLHDADAMKEMELPLSAESVVYADAAYTDYAFEDQMKQVAGIEWLSQRKVNSKRIRSKQQNRAISKARKRIETVFSQIKDMFKRKIHAVTIEGYMLKIKYFLFAFQLKHLI